jgi:hypothetical protein
LQGIARRVGRSFLHRGCGHGLILRCISKSESSLGSQAVGSLAYYFSVRENPRHSRGLGWRTPVSDRRFMTFRSSRGGFRAPISERHFPISISACRRPVRYLTETGFGVPFGCDVTDDAGIYRRCFVICRAISTVSLFPTTRSPRSSRYATRRSERTWLFGFLFKRTLKP